jgi:hypothetical protein
MHVHMDYALDLALSFMFQSYICFFSVLEGTVAEAYSTTLAGLHVLFGILTIF